MNSWLVQVLRSWFHGLSKSPCNWVVVHPFYMYIYICIDCILGSILRNSFGFLTVPMYRYCFSGYWFQYVSYFHINPQLKIPTSIQTPSNFPLPRNRRHVQPNPPPAKPQPLVVLEVMVLPQGQSQASGEFWMDLFFKKTPSDQANKKVMFFRDHFFKG